MTKKDDIEKLKEERDYLKKWLANLDSAQELVPDVQKKLEQLEWEISALEESPEEAEEISIEHLSQKIDRDYRILPIALPMIHPFTRPGFAVYTSSSTSGSSDLYEYVTRVGDLNTPIAQEYSTKYSILYNDLEATQKRPNDIRNLLTILGFLETLKRFEEAYENIYSYKSSSRYRKAAANSMRNFIEGIKGDLYKKARTHPTENMTWDIMSKRLVKKMPPMMSYIYY